MPFRTAAIIVFALLVSIGEMFAVAPALSSVAQVKVSGTVRIPRNAMSPLAIVELRGVDGRSVLATTKTDATGKYSVSASVPEGWYKIMAGSPACAPIMVPLYVEGQSSLEVAISLKKYELKEANVRFLPIPPTNPLKGKLTPVKDQQGCWSVSVPCGGELHYQVAGDEVEGRTHCPSGFVDFTLDEGGDCIGVYKCSSDSMRIDYCPDINPADRGTESVTFLDNAAEHRRTLYASIEGIMDTLTVLRNLNQIDAWYQQAHIQANKAIGLLQSETDNVSRSLILRSIIEMSAIAWYVKKDNIDAHILQAADDELLRYPSTWSLNHTGALAAFAFFAPAPRVQQHFEALETSNTADKEYLASVLSNLVEVYDHLKNGPMARNYERLLLDKYTNTATSLDFADRKRSSAKLLGHLAKSIRGTTPQGAEAELTFPMAPPRLVLLDFWATWCRPCIAEIDHMLTVTDSIRARGIEIIGIAVNDKAEKVIEFRKRKAIPWESIMLPKAVTTETLEFYNANAIPQMVLIAPDGRVLAQGEALRGARMLETIDAATQTQKP